MTTAQDFCRALLSCGDLESKLRPPRDPPPTPGALAGRAGEPRGRLLAIAETDEAGTAAQRAWLKSLPSPARDAARSAHEKDHAAGDAEGRLPSLDSLRDPKARVACLLRFAHHELQAIELFAWAILRFPTLPAALLRGFLLVLEEEQIHLRLYLDRLAAHGATLSGGSDYLWRHVAAIDVAADPVLSFLSAVGLTFEQANLDFAGLYREAFLAAGDHATADVLARVHHDEIRHVRLAIRWLHRLKRPDESDLQAYLRAVPFPLGPARAKGRRFDLIARRHAGLDDELIQHIAQAQPYRRSAPDSRGSERSVWLLPNLGAEEDDQPLPKSARGFLRGLHGAWASLFPSDFQPWLLPPGDVAALSAWQQALPVSPHQAALPVLQILGEQARGHLLPWLNTVGAADCAHELRLPLWGPSPQVVRRIHEKTFAQEQAARLGLVPDCLRGAFAVIPPDLCREPARRDAVLLAHLSSLPRWLVGDAETEFVLKPALSTSGRGRVHGHLQNGALAAALAESAWHELAHRGGAIVEPWLMRRGDYSVQLAIGMSGEGASSLSIEVLGTTTQVVAPSGLIRGNRGLVGRDGAITLCPETRGTADELPGELAALEAPLRSAAVRLGQAAAEYGYVGIAGIDAFVFRGPKGALVLRPVVELNARFTTGTVALGLVRRAQQAGLCPPAPFAWAFLLKTPPKPALDAVADRVCCIHPLSRGPALLLAPRPEDLDGFCSSLDLRRSSCV